MADWQSGLRASPLPWLLEATTPAVRHLALQGLLDLRADDAEVAAARAAAMSADPIAAILAAQHPEGWWIAPGPGYLPKYSATTWQLSFLEMMGADPADERVRRACEYVLRHTQTSSGAFGAVTDRTAGQPPPSSAIHCLNGNLLRALIGFGRLDDERVQRSLDWEVAAILGDASIRYYAMTPGSLFRCGPNDGEPCAWGATKALLALARIPLGNRSPRVRQAIDAAVEFLLSRDPAVADYPMARSQTKPNGSWFKLGFPVGYVSDVLQVLEALAAAGAAADSRLDNAVAWLVDRQTPEGRWTNEYAYAGKMIVDVDVPHEPSKWVTLRACRVLRAVAEARAPAAPPWRAEPARSGPRVPA